jgi:NitT/TauT family transport system ATP-binding protein
MSDSSRSTVADSGSGSLGGDDTLVEYVDVSKTYGSGESAVTAVESFDTTIDRGEFVSFVGPSGCGKTTLLHIATGLVEPTSGTVRVDGTDVQSEDHQEHEVGLVFQKPVLLDWRTVRKNVLLPVEGMKENGLLSEDMDYYQDRADELLEMVGLGGFEDAYPDELSGGMQQRTSICRSLITDPSLLLMDEPFGALDALTRDNMNDELLDIWSETNKTIIFVTHNLEEAVYLSDRVFVLSHRPANLLDDIHVDLPRPRTDETRASERFQELHAQTNSYF